MALNNTDVKQKILIADDSEINRALLIDILGDGFEFVEAADGVEAVDILQNGYADISLVLLDIHMPRVDGFGVLEAMNKRGWIDDTPVIIISADSDSDFAQRAYNLGVTDYIRRPFDAYVVRRRVQNTLMLYEKQKKLMGLVAEQVYELQKNNSMMINILSHIVEFQNEESGPHIQHIRIITEILLKGLCELYPRYQFSQAEIALIGTASALHDIGKVSIPSAILNKPGRLTPEEFAVMKTHSAIGASMLDVLPIYKDEPLVKTAYQICRWHHERYDGRGYPDGLKGDEIPIAAQVVSLADVYDALTSERVYKKAIPHKEAIRMIKNGECGAFNPILMNVLDKVADEIYGELHGATSENYDDDLRKITAEILQKNSISSSGRTVSLLERERKKYMFFASMSDEVMFELSYTPYLLTFLNGGGKRLGVSETIVPDPMNSGELHECCGEDKLKEIAALLHAATPENSIIRCEGDIKIDGDVRHCKLVAQAMWSSGAEPELIGAIGKIYRAD